MKLLLSIIFSLTSLIAYSQTNKIEQTGNVGIGTTSPTNKLDIRGTITIDNGTNASIFTGIGTTELHRYLTLLNSAGLSSASGLKAGGVLVADAYAYANPGKNDLIVKGNIGIGTPSPTSKLSIDGNINGWLISSKATVTAAGEYNGIKLLTGYPNDTNKWAAVVATAEDLHSNLTALAFYSTASEKMRIAGNGNVGIGTTSPQAKLAVNGNILAKEVKVKTDISVPDYVFEPEYKMLSLPEIENYVKEHKHLPEIPSAKEIEEEGLGLGAMNLLLLKKVEELTLHLIEKEKQALEIKGQLMELSKEVASLKKDSKN